MLGGCPIDPGGRGGTLRTWPLISSLSRTGSWLTADCGAAQEDKAAAASAAPIEPETKLVPVAGQVLDLDRKRCALEKRVMAVTPHRADRPLGPDPAWGSLYRAGAVSAAPAVGLFLVALVIAAVTVAPPTSGGTNLLVALRHVDKGWAAVAGLGKC